jgi:hypothetical protein
MWHRRTLAEVPHCAGDRTFTRSRLKVEFDPQPTFALRKAIGRLLPVPGTGLFCGALG